MSQLQPQNDPAFQNFLKRLATLLQSWRVGVDTLKAGNFLV
jgi:hypothetical protein